MKSLYVCFPSVGKVEVREETIAPPDDDEILCQSEESLISIGTETNCLRGDFDLGTNWAAWVQYPFRPGYSMAARVVAVGKAVTGVQKDAACLCGGSTSAIFQGTSRPSFSNTGRREQRRSGMGCPGIYHPACRASRSTPVG